MGYALVDARGRKVGLLLSSSLTALLVGGGASSAWAACVNTIGAAFDNPIAQTTPCIAVTATSFAGNITNEGTIAPGGINFTNGSITGFISSSGTIAGGISLDGKSLISSSGTGIAITGPTFTGGISNSGTISAARAGILVGAGCSCGSTNIATFAGGIANLGTISAGGPGIFVGAIAFGPGSAATISTFTGGISNGGTIAVAGGTPFGPFSQNAGIAVGGLALLGSANVVNFSGGISNGKNGTISGAGNGIFVGATAASGGSVKLGSFAGGISNSGTISALGSGILVGGDAFGTGSSVTISNFSGGISNSGVITIAGGKGGGQNSGIFVGGLGTHVAGSGGSVTISTFAGGISNSGTIAVAGGKGGGQSAGIFVGGNAFASGSSVTLSAFSGGISNSGTISVVTGGGSQSVGILVGGNAFGSGSSVTISAFSGGISNSGTITVAAGGGSQSAGILVGGNASRSSVTISTFSGGISNSGTITVADRKGGSQGVGIFVAGSSGGFVTISTFAGGITNSGTISAGTGISVEGVSTFLGNISNSGSILAANTGIFICNCVTFAGGSIVNTGTISGAAGIVVHNSSPVGIFDSGTIVGTGGTAIDLTGASGGNTLTLGPGYKITGNVLGFAGGDTLQLGGIGSGSFDLSSVGATQQYQNFTTFNVVSGTWTVSNVFGQSQAWNVNGGTLAGTGTLAAVNVNTSGTLEPGTIGAPGTFMTITGNLAFQSGARYVVNISPATASRANVGGTVSLDGSVVGILAPGSYSGKTTYDILDPPSISGKFTGFTSNAPAFVGTLSYTSSEVLLNLTAALGAGGGLTTNQQNLATAINTSFNKGGTLPAGLFPLFGLTAGNLGNALTQLDGEVATDAQKGAFGLLDQFLELMLDPFVDGRSAGTPGMNSFAPERDAGLPDDVARAYARALKAPAMTLKAAPAATLRWSTWAADFGGYNRTNGDAGLGSSNVIARDYGFAGGADYHFTPDTAVGFALAGGGTNWGLAQARGGGRSDAFSAGLYATTHAGPAYVAGALAFADHWFSTNRTALGDQLSASFNGQSFGARLEAGYRYGMPFNTAAVGITPYAAVQTQVFHTPSYNESDLLGAGLGLAYAATNATDTRSELGARFDNLTALNGMPLLWRGRVAWAHDWVGNPSLSAAFQALPGASFVVNGAPAPANSALTSVSADLKITPAWSLQAKFDGELAPNAQTYAGTGTVRYKW
jgi:uncharacterized protein with beta-barrel porin domain